MKVNQYIENENQVCAYNYHPLPVVIEKARDVWMWDVEGKRYLDFMSAYSAVSHGHLHPRLVRAATEQLGRVAVTSRAFHSVPLAPFLKKLCQIAGFDKALPMNTGAEAVETAVKAARRWGYRVKGIPSGKAEILVAKNNFHGRTTTIVSFSSEPDYQADFGPFTPGFKFFELGDLASLEAALTPNTCAVIMEPIQGEAGIIVPPEGYLRAVRELCTKNNILLILDEIQSGLGRTGRMFAFEHEGIQPDGLILGKALGGGMLPVSAFLANDAVMNVFRPGSHGSTFGGNALAAAVALEALNIMEDDQLVGRSAVLGRYLIERLRAIPTALIRDVRGKGLWVGVDIDPTKAKARAIVERLAQKGVLSKETHETVIRFAPPLTITKQDLDWALDQFEQTLAEFEPAQVAPAKSESSLSASPPSFARLMLSAPDFFEVSYAINPWMDPKFWSIEAERLAQDAKTGWNKLKSMYESLGVTTELMPPVQGQPDMVFTANSAFVLDGKVLLASYLHKERQGEEAHGRAMFDALKQRGVLQSLHQTPEGVYFEGAGDAIWDAARGIVWMGYGQRSSQEASKSVRDLFHVPTVSLKLTSSRFYHLDTCFCLLSGGEVIYWPEAFDEAGRKLLQEVLGDKLIEAGEEDTSHLGLNSVCLDKDVVMCYCSNALRDRLEKLGYRVHVVDLGSFNRSGGAAYCLTLRLDNRSTAGVDQRQLAKAA